VALPILALYADDWAWLLRRWWSDPNYSHGFFVPLFALYFVWEKWESLRAMVPRPSLTGLLPLLLGLLLKAATLFFGSFLINCVSMLFVISGAVLLVAGLRIFRVVAVPVLFLLLMVPLPAPIYERIALPLQRLAAAITTTVLQGVGIPAFQAGNVIELPEKALEVVEACSGIRLLTGFVALGVAFAYLSRRPPWERIVLVLSTVPIAVLANVARVVVAAFCCHWGLDSLADGLPHAATALALFAFSALLLLGERFALSRLFVDAPAATAAD
jgi:exosortase